MRIVQLVHSLPERTRLRCSWLRGDVADATRLAERLASLPGMIEVRARPFTGSIVCVHGARLDAASIMERVRDEGRAELLLGPGERPPRGPVPQVHSRIATAAAAAFRGLNEDFVRITDGRADLGTLATLGFLGASVGEVTMTGKLPAPPWFNLAWWSFRTFMSLEQEAIDATARATASTPPAPPPEVGKL